MTRRAVKRGWRVGDLGERRRVAAAARNPRGLRAHPCGQRPRVLRVDRPAVADRAGLAGVQRAPRREERTVLERAPDEAPPTQDRGREERVVAQLESRQVGADPHDRRLDLCVEDRRAREPGARRHLSSARTSGGQADGLAPRPQVDLEELGLERIWSHERAGGVAGGPGCAAADSRVDAPVAVVGGDLDRMGRGRLADPSPGCLAGREPPRSLGFRGEPVAEVVPGREQQGGVVALEQVEADDLAPGQRSRPAPGAPRSRGCSDQMSSRRWARPSPCCPSRP